MKVLWLALAALCGLGAQPLQVYSEFAQLDANGKVIAPEFPREILSPGLIRNGFTSFQVVVTAPAGTPWELFVAQNPDEAVAVSLYRMSGDKLEAVQQGVRGSGTQVFWMDLWADRNYTVSRIKVEPQLRLGNDWAIYPMEARMMTARVPEANAPKAEVCGAGSGARPEGSTIAALRYRNATQDRLLAGGAPAEELAGILGDCAASKNPEAYLRIRDYLFRRLGGA